MADKGMFRGQPMSPNGKKFSLEFQGIPVHIDRPRGFVMSGTDSKGKPWKRQYKYNYGYIPRTKGGDGDQLDVFLGPKKKAPNAFWAIQKKEDGSFDEYKVFLGFDNRDEAAAAYRAHIPKKLMVGIVTMRVDMMKAMLGIDGNGYGSNGIKKTAQFVGFLDEFEKIADSEGIGRVKDFVAKHLTKKSLGDRVVGAAKELKKDIREHV